MSVIEIDNLVKKYGSNVAVNGLSLKIEKDKIYGFLGPNGAGKSTTMNIITGYIGATSGSVRLNGHDILKEVEEAKKSFGYLPEIPPLYPEMTVREYLDFVAELKKIKKKERTKAVEEAMELAKLTQVEGRLIKNLSKGYKQRVGIAQAVMGMPEIIILDEPTVGLDPKQIIEIRQLIKDLGENHTVILSSHILTEISEVCEHIFIISQGKLVASGTEEELVQKLAGETKVVLELKGSKAEAEDALNKVSEIQDFNIKETEDGIIKAEVVTDRECDIREELFYVLAEYKLPIMSMKLDKKTLEDIFIELTSEQKIESDKIETEVEENEEAEVRGNKKVEAEETEVEENEKEETEVEVNENEIEEADEDEMEDVEIEGYIDYIAKETDNDLQEVKEDESDL